MKGRKKKKVYNDFFLLMLKLAYIKSHANHMLISSVQLAHN